MRKHTGVSFRPAFLSRHRRLRLDHPKISAMAATPDHIFRRRSQPFLLLFLAFALSLLAHRLSPAAAADFEGFADEFDDEDADAGAPAETLLPPPTLTRSDLHRPDPSPHPPSPSPSPSSAETASATIVHEYWDEDEFEGFPVTEEVPTPDAPETPDSAEDHPKSEEKGEPERRRLLRAYTVEIVCVSFLIAFVFNYFAGKKENENIALAWAARFATKDSIFEKNFSLLGTGDGKDTPLLLKEGQSVFKFYASGRRFCHAVLATMELKSRHDLIARLYNLMVPCKDEISFEVFMNDEAMDHVVFALAKKKLAKAMHKEVGDLQRYANLVQPQANRKWVAEELSVVSESREVAGDMITETVLDQVFGEKAFEKHGSGFISLHFSDQHASGSHRKLLLFKFVLPDAKNMADMTRLVALVPYYIDLVGRYKVNPQVRSKTDAARAKAAQEAYKELQLARQEALQKKKSDKKKIVEEAEAKLTAEAVRKKEEKERARQMKKAMPKMKMTRAR